MSPIPLSLLFLSLTLPFTTSSPPPPATVCIIGAGISGSTLSHYLRQYSPTPSPISTILIFDKSPHIGGRMRTITISNHTFEAGASIIHPKNYHLSNFTELLKLRKKGDYHDLEGEEESVGVWDGRRFLYRSWVFCVECKILKSVRVVKWFVKFVNGVKLVWRYGYSLVRMQNFVQAMLDNFLKFYEDVDTRPVFGRVENMLKWSGLYNYTRRTLKEELVEAGLSPLLIRELVTVITRINYGQSTHISGLAGAVSLAGSGGGLWAVEGGNWQIAAGLINGSDVELHLSEEIKTVSYRGNYYELNSTKEKSYKCQVAVFATPLDEVNVKFDPHVSIPERKMQHTYTTFIRGLIDPAYFGLSKVEKVPDLVGTLEDPSIPFSCISVLKKLNSTEVIYKMFSRKPLDDDLLDQIFSIRKETIRIDWAAYPHYDAPEKFAPFMLDDWHLYYVNTFESAASAMETGAVAAENMARLIHSRLAAFAEPYLSADGRSSASGRCKADLHADL